VVSWSSIDYYNNWKAQHYRMRDVLAPLALGVESKDGKLNYYTMSDYLQDHNDLKLTVQVIDFSTENGKNLLSVSMPRPTTAGSSKHSISPNWQVKQKRHIQ
jgi:hypothetical protein